MQNRIVGWSGLLLSLVVGGACATRQLVPLDLGPGPVELYVDGERADEVPVELELRADRDHKLFVKRAGFVPQLVVLEASEVDGRDQLAPEHVRVRLEPIAGNRELRIEDASEEADGSDREATGSSN